MYLYVYQMGAKGQAIAGEDAPIYFVCVCVLSELMPRSWRADPHRPGPSVAADKCQIN